MNTYPDFFDAVPSITVRDPLAAFLGTRENGRIEYSYHDAVKLAGHSCPTVATAYWLAYLGLRALYGENLPERGALRVEFRNKRQDGTTGVIAKVIALITGAAEDDGFKGLGGRFDRRDLLLFNARIPLDIRFTRITDGATVELAADLSTVAMDPEIRRLMQRCLSSDASPEETQRFGLLWQDRVRRILLEHGNDSAVFVVRRSAAMTA